MRIVAVSRAPRAFLAARGRIIGTLVDEIDIPTRGPSLAEGTFVEVRDTSAKWLAVAGYSARTEHYVASASSGYKPRAR